MLFFGNSFGMFVLLHQFRVARTARSCRAVDSNHDRQRALYGFNTTVDVAFHCNLVFTYFQNFFCVCDLGQSQLFCYLRTYLRRIPVDSLTTTNNNVTVTYFADSSSQRVRSSQCICTGESTVGQQVTVICTTEKSFTNNVGSTTWSHCQNGNGRAWMSIFQSKSLLESIQVFGIEDSGECRTVNGSVGFHGILPNITCVGNLFCQYNNFQTHVINFSISISTSR